MTYSTVDVQLTPGQTKKLGSKSAKECGITLTLKPAQMSGGPHKLSLTANQIKQFGAAVMAHRGIRLEFSKAAVANMIKNGGILPILAPIFAAVAAAAPAVAKAAALGAVGTAAGIGVKKILGQGYKRGGGKQGGIIHPMMVPALMAAAPTIARLARRKIVGLGYKKKGRGFYLPGTPHSFYKGRG